MKKFLHPAVLVATVLLSSCVPSVNPLFTEKDLVFDPALVGAWGPENGKETWTFEKSGEKKYKLLQTDENGRVAEFEVHLVQLKDERFLDPYVINPGAEGEWKVNQHAAFGMIIRPAHMFMKMWRIEPALQLAYLNPDWLDKFLKQNPKALRHERVNFNHDKEEASLVLTAETKDLQTFVLEHSREAFGEADKDGLIRKEKIKPATPAPKSP